MLIPIAVPGFGGTDSALNDMFELDSKCGVGRGLDLSSWAGSLGDLKLDEVFVSVSKPTDLLHSRPKQWR